MGLHCLAVISILCPPKKEKDNTVLSGILNSLWYYFPTYYEHKNTFYINISKTVNSRLLTLLYFYSKTISNVFIFQGDDFLLRNVCLCRKCIPLKKYLYLFLIHDFRINCVKLSSIEVLFSQTFNRNKIDNYIFFHDLRMVLTFKNMISVSHFPTLR